MKLKYFLFTVLFLLTLSFNSYSQLNKEWASTLANKSNIADAVVKVDNYGYIYVAGTFAGTSSKDWKVIKYHPDGSQVWTRTCYGSTEGDDYVNDMAVNSAGETFICGSFYENSEDMALVKLEADGDIAWTATVDGENSAVDIAYALILDGSGNVYVSGECENRTYKDAVLIKYNSSGTEQWKYTYDGTSNQNEVPAAMTFDAGGSVIITGYTEDTDNIKFGLVLKVSTSGSQTWAATATGNGTDCHFTSVVSDASSNIYACGTTYKDGTADYVIVKYNSSGTLQWTSKYDGPATNGADHATCLVMAGSYIYVTGRSEGTSSSVTTYDYCTIKYNTSGTLQWAYRYNGSANGSDEASKIVADFNGDLIVTGTSDGGTSELDYYTHCVDASGAELWSDRHVLTYNGDDRASGLAADAFGNVYMTGVGQTASTAYDFVTVKYADREKNAEVIQSSLSTLASGFLDVVTISSVRNYLYNNIDSGYYDSIPKHFYKSMLEWIDIAESNNYYLRDTVNKTLNKIKNTSSIDYVTPILSKLWWEGKLMTPFITVPYFRDFDSGDLNVTPNIGYVTPLEENYPVAGYTGFVTGTSVPDEDSFTKTDAQTTALLLFTTMVAPPCYIDGEYCMEDLVACL
jgi:hypothetical protein